MDPIFATTPEPPYTAVVFTSIRTDGDGGYGAMSDAMTELAAPAARRDEIAQSRGRERWYEDYRVLSATGHRDDAVAAADFAG